MPNSLIEIPLRITISLDEAGPQGVSATHSHLDVEGFERVVIDQDYANRKGYDTFFLGEEVALPLLNEEQQKNSAKNALASAHEDNTLLPYHNFTIVMNRRRQLAYYTAVNIHGAMAQNPERKGDQWHFDPRIAESEQIGGDLYARNQLDRGHLVRRLDPAWGSEAVWANNDTFHFTNCSPQHANFNQNIDTWLGLENYLLKTVAQAGQQRLTIFTGPVLTEIDPLYRGVRLPLHFWKIAVRNDANGSLVVTAYLLSQAHLVKQFDGLEAFTPNTFQVTLEEIMGRTELNFSHLINYQVDLGRSSRMERNLVGNIRVALSALGDMIV